MTTPVEGKRKLITITKRQSARESDTRLGSLQRSAAPFVSRLARDPLLPVGIDDLKRDELSRFETDWAEYQVIKICDSLTGTTHGDAGAHRIQRGARFGDKTRPANSPATVESRRDIPYNAMDAGGCD